MKLYPIPGGDWAGTEADWKKAMKAKGLDPKQFEETKSREVPTGKKELMEFLTFYGVDVYRMAGETTVPNAAPAAPSAPDLDALRALHNPGGVRPSDLATVDTTAPLAPIASAAPTTDLDAVFAAAPIGQQLQLAVVAIDGALSLLSPR